MRTGCRSWTARSACCSPAGAGRAPRWSGAGGGPARSGSPAPGGAAGGAEAVQAELVLADSGWSGDDRVDVVVAPDWQHGMGASLRAGLSILEDGGADAALVSLVDLPDVGEDVVRRVLSAGSGPRALVRATYAGRPGHPVLMGREHWSGAAASADGDSGARAYLDSHDLTLCACDDLATGRDVDRPEDLSG